LAVALAFFAPTQFKDETAPAARSAKAVADALNGALRMSANPEQTLDAFVKSLGTSEAIQFRRAGVNSPPHPVEVQTPLGQVPRWFVDLLAIPEIGAAFPVLIDGNRIGDIIFSPDLSAEIFEKWVGFVAIACSIIALTLQTGVIAYFTVGGALAPLRDIGEGMSRLRKGDYDHPTAKARVPCFSTRCLAAMRLSIMVVIRNRSRWVQFSEPKLLTIESNPYHVWTPVQISFTTTGGRAFDLDCCSAPIARRIRQSASSTPPRPFSARKLFAWTRFLHANRYPLRLVTLQDGSIAKALETIATGLLSVAEESVTRPKLMVRPSRTTRASASTSEAVTARMKCVVWSTVVIGR